MKKICFVLDQFLYGGIEKVFLNYASGIDKDKYQIDVIVLSDFENMIEQIPKECNLILKHIPRYHAPTSRASTMIRRKGGAILYYMTYLLKKIFIYPIDYFKFRNIRKTKYDVAISFSGHVNDIYAVLDLIKANKKIVWAHGMIYQYLLMSPSFEKMYTKFDKIVSVNNLDQSDIFYCKPYLDYKIENLYNPISKKDTISDSENLKVLKKEYGNFIVSVARLDYPKDFETLINAYALLNDKLKEEYSLVIVGDGPDRKKIENLIEELKLNKVFLVGSKDNVADYYKAASLFVLSTLSEGLGMVIIEAMANGTPVIATDAPYGPRDILQNEYGILCPVRNAKILSQKIEEILESKDIQKYYSEKGLIRSKDFELEVIINKLYRILGD